MAKGKISRLWNQFNIWFDKTGYKVVIGLVVIYGIYICIKPFINPYPNTQNIEAEYTGTFYIQGSHNKGLSLKMPKKSGQDMVLKNSRGATIKSPVYVSYWLNGYEHYMGAIRMTKNDWMLIKLIEDPKYGPAIQLVGKETSLEFVRKDENE